ncbi:MAG: BspA family leucine-rich repeat surface protein, partial [Intestinibacter sp.]
MGKIQEKKKVEKGRKNIMQKIRGNIERKKEQGITLIALVVTIIIILILAGITINMILGENGIIRTAQDAKNTWENAIIKEQENLNSLINELNEELIDRSRDIYVFLYDDGTLTFSNTSEPVEGKNVLKAYGDIKGQEYTSEVGEDGSSITVNTPWVADVGTITKVEILDEIKPTSTACWFANCNQLTEITGIENFNTSNVTDMKYMFAYCSSLTNLDLKSFNTNDVTNMACMFYYCQNLESLDVSEFVTNNVSDMRGMFGQCKSLTSLDVTNFNTSKVIDMNSMFLYCTKLTNLDISNFRTNSVTNMRAMFDFCESLTNLDVSNFNTSKVTNMAYMFAYMTATTEIKGVENFDTSNVTDMACMFYQCHNLASIDVSNFNTNNVTNMRG